MYPPNLKSVALPVLEIIGGTPKIWAVPGYVYEANFCEAEAKAREAEDEAEARHNEAEAEKLASRPHWPRGLNIPATQPIIIIQPWHL